MKLKKLAAGLLSPDVFKAVFFFVSILGVCPLVAESIEPFLKLFHIYAFAAILHDLFTEKRILRNQGRTLLVLFGLSYVGTLLTNTNLISFSGLSNFCYLLAALALVYSYGKDSLRRDHVSVTVLCILITLANIVGIWMFFVKFFFYVPGRGFIGMYPGENRLAGLFGNPNVLGFVCMGAICLCAIHFCVSVSRWGKIGFAVMGGINLLTLLLANSRTQIYSLVFMSAVLAFMLTLKPHAYLRRIPLAIGTAVLCAAVAFGGCKLVQRGVSLLDTHYNFYVEKITTITAEQMHMYQSPIMATKPTTTPVTTPVTEQEQPGTEATEEHSTTPQNTQTVVRQEADGGLNGRITIWLEGLRIFAAKPIFGGGLDNHDTVLKELGYAGLPVRGNLHNVYLDVLVCCGIAGFACLMAFLLLMLRNVIYFFYSSDGKRWVLGCVMLSCIAAFMLDGVADSTMIASFYPTAVAFWFIASEFAGLMEEEGQETGWYRRGLLCKMTDRFRWWK